MQVEGIAVPVRHDFGRAVDPGRSDLVRQLPDIETDTRRVSLLSPVEDASESQYASAE